MFLFSGFLNNEKNPLQRCEEGKRAVDFDPHKGRKITTKVCSIADGETERQKRQMKQSSFSPLLLILMTVDRLNCDK